MSKCGNCCYGVMTGPNRMFCSAQNCSCEEVFDCEDYDPIVKPQTNADRVRAMSDEELADKFEVIQLETVKAYGNDNLLLKGELKKYWLDWLREEVADGEQS